MQVTPPTWPRLLSPGAAPRRQLLGGGVDDAHAVAGLAVDLPAGVHDQQLAVVVGELGLGRRAGRRRRCRRRAGCRRTCRRLRRRRSPRPGRYSAPLIACSAAPYIVELVAASAWTWLLVLLVKPNVLSRAPVVRLRLATSASPPFTVLNDRDEQLRAVRRGLDRASPPLKVGLKFVSTSSFVGLWLARLAWFRWWLLVPWCVLDRGRGCSAMNTRFREGAASMSQISPVLMRGVLCAGRSGTSRLCPRPACSPAPRPPATVTLAVRIAVLVQPDIGDGLVIVFVLRWCVRVVNGYAGAGGPPSPKFQAVGRDGAGGRVGEPDPSIRLHVAVGHLAVMTPPRDVRVRRSGRPGATAQCTYREIETAWSRPLRAVKIGSVLRRSIWGRRATDVDASWAKIAKRRSGAGSAHRGRGPVACADLRADCPAQ